MILAIGWCWGCHSSATSKQRKHHVNIVLTQSAIKYKSLSGNFTKDCKILMCILVYSFMVFRVFKIIAVLGFVLIDMGLDALCCLIDILSFLDCDIFHYPGHLSCIIWLWFSKHHLCWEDLLQLSLTQLFLEYDNHNYKC